MAERDVIEARFRSDISRVLGLVILYEAHAGGVFNDDPKPYPDLLRSAVVFLHASMEDLLRSLAEWKLPTAPAASLERIALAGVERDKQQFTLMDLAEFRGQSVDSVIARSVSNHLNRSNYNHPGDIIEVLRRTEIDFTMPDDLKSQLAAMMIRRHLIAHTGDRDESEEVSPQKPQQGNPILPENVRSWITSVITLGESVLARV